jgi:hypothetical protein
MFLLGRVDVPAQGRPVPSRVVGRRPLSYRSRIDHGSDDHVSTAGGLVHSKQRAAACPHSEPATALPVVVDRSDRHATGDEPRRSPPCRPHVVEFAAHGVRGPRSSSISRRTALTCTGCSNGGCATARDYRRLHARFAVERVVLSTSASVFGTGLGRAAAMTAPPNVPLELEVPMAAAVDAFQPDSLRVPSAKRCPRSRSVSKKRSAGLTLWETEPMRSRRGMRWTRGRHARSRR